MNDSNAGRYVFGITGQIKEIIYPSKAILGFKYNGKEEKAILLVHKLHVDNVPVEEHRLMSDFVKVGDIIDFDGHIYDKGGFGNSKDRCNYYAMRAWKASQSKVLAKEQMLNGKAGRPPLTVGTGWISEIFPRKGVLTFNNNGQDERVLFLASKVYIFEKRLGTKQSLDQVRQLKKIITSIHIPFSGSFRWGPCSIWGGAARFPGQPLLLFLVRLLGLEGETTALWRSKSCQQFWKHLVSRRSSRVDRFNGVEWKHFHWWVKWVTFLTPPRPRCPRRERGTRFWGDRQDSRRGLRIDMVADKAKPLSIRLVWPQTYFSLWHEPCPAWPRRDF